MSEPVTRTSFLPVKVLIHQMKQEGITFHHISEKKAKKVLTEESYCFKVMAQAANYDTVINHKGQRQYIHLDFAYLAELTALDLRLRSLVIQMCLDIENSLRSLLFQEITANPDAEESEIIAAWDPHNEHRHQLNDNLSSSYCKSLVAKYSPGFPLAVMLELTHFGALSRFTVFYDKRYPHRIPFDVSLLGPVRDLRNASAHHNCLLFDVRHDSGGPINPIIAAFAERHCIKGWKIWLRNKPLHDLACLIYLYPRIVRDKNRCHKTCKILEKFFNKRMLRHKSWFRRNAALRNAYRMMKLLFEAVAKEQAWNR
ncbi:MAG: Abi family protein [Acidaminococcus sp.]|nr:Abi family protein [Acidaminococcus sp.]MCI2114231.1 Abi family protein [Acidaminococcus sp.]MCI2116166.1 Abi family protein [Acidaminococcus sp.]